MRRRNWPIVLAILFIAQLVWYLFYTERIVQALRTNAEGLSRIYALVQESIGDSIPPPADETLFRLQGIILETGVPLVLTGEGDTVLAAANLPFQADLSIPEDQARVRDFSRRLALQYPPVGDPTVALLHYGDPPEVRGLRWIPWLQAGGLFLTVILGFLSIKVQRRAEGERVWAAMARELAHQLGTPISSLQGWLEVLRLPRKERPEELEGRKIAREMGADLSRLERISLRFELIGRETELREVDLEAILRSLRRYLEVRIPRLASGVGLELDLPESLPPVMGNEVLLTWALENLVNNALDALGGKGGTIRIQAREDGSRGVVVSVSDTGPGVSTDLRDRIFEPGVTTKARGWGVGLTLSRRIVESMHGGRLELGHGDLGGATFRIRLPSVPDRGR